MNQAHRVALFLCVGMFASAMPTPLGAAVLARGTVAPVVLRGAEFLSERANPARLVRQVARNYRDRRFYGMDSREYGSIRDALVKGALAPTDFQQNVRGAFARNFHPAPLAAGLFMPLAIEAQRQIASGKGFRAGELVRTLEPRVIGTTYAFNVAGEVTGAALQSGLAHFGPAGAAAGFVVRPALGFLGTVTGMAVGDNLAQGKSFRASIAASLRKFEPGRDFGMMLGGMIGASVVQALVPIPVIPGMVGGLLGSTLGAAVGAAFDRTPALARLDRWLDERADSIEQRPANGGPRREPSATRPVGQKITLLGQASS